MTARPPNKARKFRGFAVFERPDGALVWGTFRPTAQAARQAFERWNPALEGQEQRAQIVAVEIRIFDNVTPEIL